MMAETDRTSCRIDWVMNGYRWPDLFFNLPDGTSHEDAVREADRRLPLLKRGFHADQHDFGYQIVGCTDSPPVQSDFPFAS